jgi:hypothetical protein
MGFAMSLSEACQNIVEHAGRGGWVGVQVYNWAKRRAGRQVVVISVADAGQGFRRSLESHACAPSPGTAGTTPRRWRPRSRRATAATRAGPRPGAQGHQGLRASSRRQAQHSQRHGADGLPALVGRFARARGRGLPAFIGLAAADHHPRARGGPRDAHRRPLRPPRLRGGRLLRPRDAPHGMLVRSVVEQRLAGLADGSVAFLDFTHIGVLDRSCADEFLSKLMLPMSADHPPRGATSCLHGLRVPSGDHRAGARDAPVGLVVQLPTWRHGWWVQSPNRNARAGST